MKVHTSINIEAQKIATATIRERLRAFDRGRSWRSDYLDILVDDNEKPITDEKTIARKLKSYKHADWYGDEYAKGEYIKGLVMSTNKSSDVATVRFGQYDSIVSKAIWAVRRRGLRAN